jgi:eukaryotic-like serine/threonine-protein kinase
LTVSHYFTMPFNAPTLEQLRVKFSQITDAVALRQGGFKQPYRATIGGQVEALKLVHVPKVSDDEAGELFRKECLGRVAREIQVLAQCQSPLLVKLGSIQATEVEFAGERFIAYSEEFLDGPDLRGLLKQQWKPQEPELRLLFVCLLKAIQQLWTLPGRFIHRDIKPDNVIRLNQPDRPFILLDLGIAFPVMETPLTVFPLHRDPPGTLPYLAPEMLQPNFREIIDYRSDLYAAALTIYECATGYHPFAKRLEQKFTTYARILDETPLPLNAVRVGLSKPFCQLVDSMLKKNPALRPANLTLLIRQMEKTA